MFNDSFHSYLFAVHLTIYAIMVNLNDDFHPTLELIRKICSNTLHLSSSTNTGVILIRSDITKVSEASLFVQAFEAVTKCRFKVYTSKCLSHKYHFSKEWVCEHRGDRLSEDRCPARIQIAVKKVNEVNKAGDGYLSLEPPLQCIISIIPFHIHGTASNNQPIKMLRISKEVRECFYSYFRRGIKGVRAKRLHEQNLKKSRASDLNDITINLRMSSIYALYRQWKQLEKHNLGRKGSGLYIRSKTPTLSNENGQLNMQSNEMSADIESRVKNIKKEVDTEPPVKIKEEPIDEEEDDNFHPIITSCRSLAPDAENCVVYYSNNETGSNANKSAKSFTANTTTASIAKRVIQPVGQRAVHPAARGVMFQSTQNDKSSTAPKYIVSPSVSSVPSVVSSFVPSVANNIVNSIVSLPKGNVGPNNCVSLMRVQSVNNGQLVVYDKSSNTYKVLNCLKVCSPSTSSIQSSDQFSSHFSDRIQLPTRMGFHKL